MRPSVHAYAGRELRREQLDHDLPAEAGLLGDEDATHGAAAQLALEHVAIGQGHPEAIKRVGQ